MARKITIDTKKLRKALDPHIAKAQAAVAAAEKNVKAAKRKPKAMGGTRGTEAPDPNQQTLNHARQMLNALKSAQYALEACCCDEATQGCIFFI